MKNILLFKKGYLSFFCYFFLLATAHAQSKGILPLTGLRYFSEGISVKNMDVSTGGAILLSNRIPTNNEITILLHQAAGFVLDNAKKTFAGAEVIILSPQGQVLSSISNALAARQTVGYTVKEMNGFAITFKADAALMKNNLIGVIKIRLYDLKSKNQLRLEMPVTFARQGERIQVSKIVKNIKSTEDTKAVICGLQAKNLKIMVDTSISVAPKMAYTSVDIVNIKGSSISGIFGGKESFWIYDNNLNEVKVTDRLLKQVKGAMENNDIDYTLKIPYRLKTTAAKIYTVRFRWESPDKTQVIDIVVPNI